MSIDIHDRYILEPDDEELQRLAALFVIDRLDPHAALEVLAMLFAPVRS